MLQLPRGFLRPRLRALYRGRLQVFLVHLRRHVLGHFFQVHCIGVADLPAHRFQGRHDLLHLVPFAGVLVKHARPLLMHLFPGCVQAQGVSVIPRRNVPPSKGRLSEFLLRAVQLRRFRPLRIRQPEPPLAQVAAQICVLVVHGAVDVLALVQHVPGDGRHGLHGALALRVRPGVGHGVKGFLQVRAQVVHPHLALVLRFHLPRQRPHRLAVYRRFPVCPVPHGPQLRVQRPHQLLQPFVLLHHPLHLRHVGVHIFQRKVFVCIAIFLNLGYIICSRADGRWVDPFLGTPVSRCRLCFFVKDKRRAIRHQDHVGVHVAQGILFRCFIEFPIVICQRSEYTGYRRTLRFLAGSALWDVRDLFNGIGCVLHFLYNHSIVHIVRVVLWAALFNYNSHVIWHRIQINRRCNQCSIKKFSLMVVIYVYDLSFFNDRFHRFQQRTSSFCYALDNKVP